MTQTNFTLEEWNIIGCSLYDGIDMVKQCHPSVKRVVLPKYEAVLKKVKNIIDEIEKKQP